MQRVIIVLGMLFLLTGLTACNRSSSLDSRIDASSDAALQQSLDKVKKNPNKKEVIAFFDALEQIAEKIGLHEAVSLSLGESVMQPLYADYRHVLHNKTMQEVITLAPQFDGDDIRKKYADVLAKQREALTKDMDVNALMERGKVVYEAKCAACHQANGQGLGPFPALTNSKIVTGPINAHIRLVNEGKPGTAMPPFSILNDVDIAAVVTYERNALGNKIGDHAQAKLVKQIRLGELR